MNPIHNELFLMMNSIGWLRVQIHQPHVNSRLGSATDMKQFFYDIIAVFLWHHWRIKLLEQLL